MLHPNLSSRHHKLVVPEKTALALRWAELCIALEQVSRSYFIADIAANHDGDLDKAKELIFLGFVTLIIGILLPVFAFAFLTKNLLKAKKSFI